MAASATTDDAHRSLWQLGGVAGVTWCIYLAITLSARSLYVTESGSHLLLVLLALFGCACGCYFFAIRLALHAPQTERLVALIVGTGILFRVTMLLSNPIEEIDLYRYLWDGAVATQGVSPFRYSPQQVLAAPSDASLPHDLARLVRLRDRSPEMAAILKRIHFGELPTIYPLVSQAVFALCTWLTPSSASLVTRLMLMKAWFVVCDLLTLWVVIRLLKLGNRPIGLALVYAWCPLLLKEIANSGHLDSLAFLLTTLAVYLAAQILFAPQQIKSVQMTAILSAAILALSVGAKIYPLILAPLLFASFVRRIGWRRTLIPALTFGLLLAALAWPMWPTRTATAVATSENAPAAPFSDAPPLPPEEVSTDPRDPSQSLRAFLSRWEMNDFLFAIVIENLRPTSNLPARQVAWFSVLPQQLRVALISRAVAFGIDEQQSPFFATRGLTSLAFLGLALWFASQAANAPSVSDWLTAAFLTIAWFWLLLPTQNPWYWTWAIPLLPFARSRVWWALSGLAFIYYLRFWFASQFPDTPLLGTGYTGPWFFDFVITWIEFVPWFVVLMIGSWRFLPALLDGDRAT